MTIPVAMLCLPYRLLTESQSTMTARPVDGLLDCHPADAAEREAAFGNVHEVWGGGLAIEEYLAWRLNSATHARACWYVGCREGRVVTSLGAYPILLQANGARRDGFSIGAVHTVPDSRRRGYAAELMAWVEDHQVRQGAEIGLLYSDIDPSYYARMGYRLCESYEGWITPEAAISSGDGALVRFSPNEQLVEVADLYRRGQTRRRIWIDRDPVYWEWICRRYPEHEWYWWMKDGEAGPGGYVQVALSASEIRIVDWGIESDSDEVAFWDSIIDWAARRGVARVGGWLSQTEATRARFELRPRTRELTMLKPLSKETPWDEEFVGDAAWFLECDHI